MKVLKPGSAQQLLCVCYSRQGLKLEPVTLMSNSFLPPWQFTCPLALQWFDSFVGSWGNKEVSVGAGAVLPFPGSREGTWGGAHPPPMPHGPQWSALGGQRGEDYSFLKGSKADAQKYLKLLCLDALNSLISLCVWLWALWGTYGCRPWLSRRLFRGVHTSELSRSVALLFCVEMYLSEWANLETAASGVPAQAFCEWYKHLG